MIRHGALIGLCALLTACSAPNPAPEPAKPVPTAPMTIESPAFAENEMIPAKYTCDGEGLIPPLTFSDIPDGTQELMLILDDPDAPSGDWVHWAVYNIPPSTTGVAEGSVPNGAFEGASSWGKPEYGPPCPPRGTHRYIFHLYALDVASPMFEQPPTKQALLQSMAGHVLEQAELTGLYTRG